LTFNDARATGNGDYVFDLEADTYRFTLRCTVPTTAPCAVSGMAPPNQTLMRTFLGSAGNWVVGIAGAPSLVKLTLTKGGVLIGSASTEPTYTTKYPTASCGGAGCAQAAVAITLQ